MLDEKTLGWLEKRKCLCLRCYNFRDCLHLGRDFKNCSDFYRYDIQPDFRDAAEFEARVAAKLTKMDIEDVPCAHGMKLFCPKKNGPDVYCGAWCLVREARLAVEEEMDNAR